MFNLMRFGKIQDKLLDAYYLLKSKYDVCPYGSALQPYWVRKDELFSKFDEGIKTDAEGLYSVTPEAIAIQIAKTLGAQTVLDAFCGIGGTAIGFARVGKKVFAVDKNLERLQMARHNAGVYDVENKIEFLNLDVFSALETVKAEATFLDPPWGGTSYEKLSNFGLKDFAIDGVKLLEMAFQNFPKVVLRVPRNFNLLELDQFGKQFTVQDNYIRSKLYSRTVYFV